MGEDARIRRALWAVSWVYKKRIITVPCKDNLAEAVRVYTLAVRSGRRDATLRSLNIGFAPPAKLLPYTVTEGTNTYTVRPLEHYNKRGWWWCPYCISLRKFVKRNGFRLEGRWVPNPGYYCPMCGISHKAVVRWNPLALRLLADGVSATRRKRHRDRTRIQD